MSEQIQIKGLPAIPPLGIGTWQWGDRLVWGYGNGYQAGDTEAAYRAALQGGVRLFDTAEFYGFGLSESLIGRYRQAYEPKPLVVSKLFPYPGGFPARRCLPRLKKACSACRCHS